MERRWNASAIGWPSSYSSRFSICDSRGSAGVARAVDRRAVAHVEQPLDGLGRVACWALELAHEDAGDELHALDAPAERITRQPSSCIMSSSRNR
jgi:hypothetical protein